MTAATFFERISDELCGSLQNNYRDNFDHIRFNDRQPRAGAMSLREWCKTAVRQRGFLAQRWVGSMVRRAFCELGPYLPRLARLHDQLEDQESRDLLVKLLAFRCLGSSHVRLPLSNADYWDKIQEIEQLADKADSIDPHFHNWLLYRINLESKGLPLQVYSTPKGVYTQMILQQYCCRRNRLPDISVKSGDTVIDCGGCWGDTAVHFAHQVGESGRVFTYEFIPSNLEIFEKNRALNPSLSQRIEIVRHAVWDASDLPVRYTDKGPGSSVSVEPVTGPDSDVTTLSIDDMVKRRGLSEVDFIKMDIEGAEMPALRGAAETIQKFRPVLAIAVYHSLSDFVDVPEFIAAVSDNYRFCLRHFTIHREETVLFAAPDH